MKRDIPELPQQATYIDRILYYVARKIAGISANEMPVLPENPSYQDEILNYIAHKMGDTQCTSHYKNGSDDNNDAKLQAEINKLMQENSSLTNSLKSVESQNIALRKEIDTLKAKAQKKTSLDIATWLSLQGEIQRDSELAKLFWNGSEDDSSTQFIRFIAKAGDWDQVIKVWDLLAARCKAEQRSSNEAEQLILEQVLAIHNLTSFRLQASLSSCDIGTRYDYKKMERSNPTGDSVQSIWLPGLVNAGGTSVKNVLVKTQ